MKFFLNMKQMKVVQSADEKRSKRKITEKEKKELLCEKEHLEEVRLLKISPCVSNASPPFTPQKNDSAGKAPKKKIRISDQQMCSLDNLEKKKFLSGFYRY